MAAIINPKPDKSEIAQILNLEELTGVDVSVDPTLVKQIGQAVIDYMKERVGAGKGIGGIELHKPYTKEYANSLEFKAAGKSINDVNMRLSGDMLESIDILSENGPEIKIGINDSEQAPKAHGHITGHEGEWKYKRKFFGITQKEFKEEILPQFRSAIKNVKDTSGELQNLAIEEILKTPDNILSDIINPLRASDLFDGEE